MKMKTQDIFSYIDHTQLKPTSTWEDIEKLCMESIRFSTASACIPPSYVKRVYNTFRNRMNICTVIGFPLGYSKTSVKLFEAEQALTDGASEIDMVINIGALKNKDFTTIYEEIHTLKKVVCNNILKVIVETCYLTEEEKIEMCKIVTDAGADYIKTSTGFGTAGATLEDVLLFKRHIGSNVKIKAAGGIKTKEDLEIFIESGCSRIGSSSAVKILCRQ